MIKYVFLLTISVFFAFRSEERIDETRMNRDLEIAKNILATLIKGSSDSFYGGDAIDAKYIRDYGVVFSIPEHLVYFHTGANTMIAIPEPPLPDFDFGYDTDVNVDWTETPELSKAEKERIDKEMTRVKAEQSRIKKEIKEVEKERARNQAKARVAEEMLIGEGRQSDIDWRGIMVTFMTDYADLIGQLEPDDRIVIHQKSPFDDLVVIWNGEEKSRSGGQTGISAEVLRRDIAAYKAGKIDKDEFVERIDIQESTAKKKVPDLEMFASIFDRFFSDDLTETFYSQGKPRYELLEDFGAVFYVRASSVRGAYARVRYYSPGESWTVKPDAEQPDDASLYPKFKEDLKSFMLDYGRTIRSLGDKDKILLDIRLRGCRDCKLPKALELSVDVSLLKQYDSQKIARENALQQIMIEEKY